MASGERPARGTDGPWLGDTGSLASWGDRCSSGVLGDSPVCACGLVHSAAAVDVGAGTGAGAGRVVVDTLRGWRRSGTWVSVSRSSNCLAGSVKRFGAGPATSAGVPAAI